MYDTLQAARAELQAAEHRVLAGQLHKIKLPVKNQRCEPADPTLQAARAELQAAEHRARAGQLHKIKLPVENQRCEPADPERLTLICSLWSAAAACRAVTTGIQL